MLPCMQLGLLPRGVALPAVEAALPLLLHPASCLRLAVVGLVTALAGAYIYIYGAADAYCLFKSMCRICP